MSGTWRSERGFTMIEVMVAAMVLAIGVLGLAAMMDGANSALGANKQREGATNLARQVIEDVDSLSYTAVDPTTITSTLQAEPGLANAGGGSGWTVVSRGVAYQLAASVTSNTTPITFKRVTVTVTSVANPALKVQQSTLQFPGGISASVPAVTNLTSDVASPVTSAGTTTVNFTATTAGTPSGVVWFVDGNPMGTATGSGSTWTFPWSISGLSDGTYVISARAFNANGSYGQAYQVNFTLSRGVPATPTGFESGFDPFEGSVDSQWFANTERNVVGYHVYRQETAPVSGSPTLVNCGSGASPVYLVTSLNCTDASPLGGAGVITVGNSSSAAANASSSITVPKPAGVAAGDFMLAAISTSNTPTGSAPSGWVLAGFNQTSNSNMESVLFYKVATASEPASYTFTSSTRQDATAGIVDYSGVDTSSNPIDAYQTASGITSGNAVGPSVTTTKADDQVVEVAGFTGSTQSLNPTAPGGTTKRIQANGASSLTFVADKTQATAGASGTFTTNPNGTVAGWVAQTIALRPVGISVNYWVVPCYYDTSGNLLEGTAAAPINAYAADNPPNAPTWTSTPLTKLPDGTTQLQWNLSSGDPDPGDSVDFYRIYRDGQRYDTVGSSTASYIDANPGGTTHSYFITAVDTHMRESTPTSTVTG